MRRLLLFIFALLLCLPLMGAQQFSDIACETTTTTGTGTINLGGAATGGYLSFAGAGITSLNTVPYTLFSGSGSSRKIETGIGTYTDASPDTLTRTADLSSDGSGAELNLSGTSTVCIGPVRALFPQGGTATSWNPTAADGATLGTSSLPWSDLFLASGAIINFNAGDVLITHSANALTVSGGDLFVPTEAYDATGWNGDLSVPTKDAVRDKIETSTLPADPGFNGVLGWDDTANAPEWWNPGTGLTASTSTIDCDTASTSAVGCSELATQAETELKADTGRTVPPVALKNYDRGALTGLEISNNSGDAVNDIDAAVGVAASSVSPYPLIENTTAALTKRIDAAWAVGDGNGGLDGTESVGGTPDTSTWYHVWLIMRSDTGVVDVAFSESASAPSIDGTPIPVAYDHYRRIGSVYNDSGGDIDPFSQVGDTFLWAQVTERNDSSDVACGAITLRTPLGVKTRPLLTTFITVTTGTTEVWLGHGDQALCLYQIAQFTSAGVHAAAQPSTVYTNTSSQIYYQFEEATTGANFMGSYGWVDDRGKM